MAATTTSSTSCMMSHLNLRANSVEPRVRTSSSQGSTPGCGKVDGLAMWLINGVATAFFASLERCSCLRIATVDDISDDATDLPLIYNDENNRQELMSGKTRRRRLWKGKKSGAYAEE